MNSIHVSKEDWGQKWEKAQLYSYVHLNMKTVKKMYNLADEVYLLNSWTLMNENICVKILRTKNGGT